jgi:hypothetical protein
LSRIAEPTSNKVGKNHPYAKGIHEHMTSNPFPQGEIKAKENQFANSIKIGTNHPLIGKRKSKWYKSRAMSYSMER